MTSPSEAKWQRDLKNKELKKIPRSWWYVPITKSVRGIPDIIGVVNGFFVALELKKTGAKPDPSRETLQKYVLSLIKDAGSPIAIARLDAETWPEVKRKLLYLSGLDKIPLAEKVK